MVPKLLVGISPNFQFWSRAIGDKDRPIRFWDQKVKDEDHNRTKYGWKWRRHM